MHILYVRGSELQRSITYIPLPRVSEGETHTHTHTHTHTQESFPRSFHPQVPGRASHSGSLLSRKGGLSQYGCLPHGKGPLVVGKKWSQEDWTQAQSTGAPGLGHKRD